MSENIKTLNMKDLKINCTQNCFKFLNNNIFKYPKSHN